MYELGRVTQ